MNARKLVLAIACTGALAALAACEHHRTISYPKVPLPGPIEAAFDCTQLDDAILKSDAVRWVMREDGARLLSRNERAMRTTGDISMDVAAAALCLFCISPTTLGDEGHHALDGVDRRLVALLALKQDKHCPASPTRLTGVTDAKLHADVETLLARERLKPADDEAKVLLAERTRLLDNLRP